MQELSAASRVIEGSARDTLVELCDNITACQIASKEWLITLVGLEVPPPKGRGSV